MPCFFLSSRAKHLVANYCYFLSRFVFFRGRLSKDTLFSSPTFILLPSFSSVFTSVYFFLAFSLILSLYLHLSDIRAQHFSFAFFSSLLYLIRNFTLSSHILVYFSVYFSDFSSHLPAMPCLILPSSSGIPVFFVSSGPFPHS